jgi:aminoglycoside phosphotransferase (APT) family kinase protein
VTEELNTKLTDVLVPVLGDGTTIENLRALTGGASRTTWAFDAVSGGRRRALILRTGPADDVHAGMELEARSQAAAAAAGAPVPHVLVASESTAALGNPFLVCDEIKGETIVRRIQRQLDTADGHARRTELLRQCAHALAAIHRADPNIPGLEYEDQVVEYRERLDAMNDTTATFEWAFRWLAAHRPPPSARVLVHGDYEDLAWFCIRAWRFGAPASLGAGGLGSIESFVRDYEQASDTSVDRAALHWWLVLATLRWGVICRFQAERHLSGQSRSVELATIGRRVSETEWDILDLLEEVRP